MTKRGEGYPAILIAPAIKVARYGEVEEVVGFQVKEAAPTYTSSRERIASGERVDSRLCRNGKEKIGFIIRLSIS
jgi:hypothetical protein